MIIWGIILLVIGIICYGVARGPRPVAPAFVGTIGWILAAVGALLLILGVLFLLVPGLAPPYAEVDYDSMTLVLG